MELLVEHYGVMTSEVLSFRAMHDKPMTQKKEKKKRRNSK
jgi:hypothetical protein